MQQTMKNLKLGFKTTIFTIAILFLFTNCSESAKRDIYFVLDMAGVLIPSETRIDLPLENEQTNEVFSFQDYCKEEYDSIFLVYPYFNTENEDFRNLKMSNRLRRKCDNSTMFDTFSTLLFIKDGEVIVFSEIGFDKIHLTPPGIPEDIYIFPFEQKFILDENRHVHIYEE